MKVNVVDLGSGLKRLDITSDWGEPMRLSTVVTDNIARDVVRREQNDTFRYQQKHQPTPCRWAEPQCNRPAAPNREPDGFDAHIDRPVRSNYGGIPWLADEAFRKDMQKYNNALSAVKKCDWPCREPMKGTEHLPQPKPQTRFVGVPAPTPCTCHEHGYHSLWFDDEDDFDLIDRWF